MSSEHQRILLIGLSGPSSSGKTTLARLLRDIFAPHITIIHEDDFYKTDAEIPVKDGIADWDCLESLNLPALEKALAHIKQTGSLPPDFESKEDQNSVGEVKVDAAQLKTLKEQASTILPSNTASKPPLKVIIMDGFLLYAESMSAIRSHFDVKLFLRTTYATAKRRREARSGYVTLEGFWQDPPGYVDKIVWPNYCQDHAFLFKYGNVEGEADESVCTELGIQPMPAKAEGDMTACIQWAFAIIAKAVEERVSG